MRKNGHNYAFGLKVNPKIKSGFVWNMNFANWVWTIFGHFLLRLRRNNQISTSGSKLDTSLEFIVLDSLQDGEFLQLKFEQ